MTEAEDGTSYRIDDPEDYSQHRRLKDILNARARVIEVRESIGEASISGEIDDRTARSYLREAITNYLLEIESIATDDEMQEAYVSHWLDPRGCDPDTYGFDDQKALAQSCSYLGTVTIEPPQHLVEIATDERYPTVTESVPDAKTIDVWGLQSILELPSPLSASFNAVVERRHRGPETISKTVTRELSEDILANAYRTANEFLRQTQVDASLTPNNRDAGFDYSDILEEGPPDVSDDSIDPQNIAADGGEANE